MDAYHQVLAKLYETTGGKENQSVDFKDLVRRLGFFGNYADIFERLSREGWIVEDAKSDFVRITHWGVKEVKNPSASGADKDLKQRTLESDANKAAAEAKELSLLLEVFARNTSAENLAAVQQKINDINGLLERLKANAN